MFLPLFIAILLGLATPTDTNNNCNPNSGTTVTTSDTDPTNPGEPGDTPPGDDTGGEGGQIKIPK
jgi:hypothetical protein